MPHGAGDETEPDALIFVSTARLVKACLGSEPVDSFLHVDDGTNECVRFWAPEGLYNLNKGTTTLHAKTIYYSVCNAQIAANDGLKRLGSDYVILLTDEPPSPKGFAFHFIHKQFLHIVEEFAKAA
jgi:hypothetical protein